MKLKSFNLKNEKGFTLLEILLVVTTIAIIGAIVIAAVNAPKQIDKSQDSVRKIDQQTTLTALTVYLSENGHYPPSIIADSFSDCTQETPCAICNTDVTDPGDCPEGSIDLSPLTKGKKFLTALPKDPTASTKSLTGYEIYKIYKNIFVASIVNGTGGTGTVVTYGCHAVLTDVWQESIAWTGCTGDGGLPGPDDNVQIDEGVAITLDTDPTISHLKIVGSLSPNGHTMTFVGSGGVLYDMSGSAITENNNHKNHLANLLESFFDIPYVYAQVDPSLNVIVSNNGSATIFAGNDNLHCPESCFTDSFNVAISGENFTSNHLYTLSASPLSIANLTIGSNTTHSITVTSPNLSISGSLVMGSIGTEGSDDSSGEDMGNIVFSGHDTTVGAITIASIGGNDYIATTDTSSSGGDGGNISLIFGDSDVNVISGISIASIGGSAGVGINHTNDQSTGGSAGSITFTTSGSVTVSDGSLDIASIGNSSYSDGNNNTSTAGVGSSINFTSGDINIQSLSAASIGGSADIDNDNNTSTASSSGDIIFSLGSINANDGDINLASVGGAAEANGNNSASIGGIGGAIEMTNSSGGITTNGTLSFASIGGDASVEGDGSSTQGGNGGNISLNTQCSPTPNTASMSGNANSTGDSTAMSGNGGNIQVNQSCD